MCRLKGRQDQFGQALKGVVLADNARARLCWQDLEDQQVTVFLVKIMMHHQNAASTKARARHHSKDAMR